MMVTNAQTHKAPPTHPVPARMRCGVKKMPDPMDRFCSVEMSRAFYVNVIGSERSPESMRPKTNCRICSGLLELERASGVHVRHCPRMARSEALIH
jgi:hypothetical protein